MALRETGYGFMHMLITIFIDQSCQKQAVFTTVVILILWDIYNMIVCSCSSSSKADDLSVNKYSLVYINDLPPGITTRTLQQK